MVENVTVVMIQHAPEVVRDVEVVVTVTVRVTVVVFLAATLEEELAPPSDDADADREIALIRTIAHRSKRGKRRLLGYCMGLRSRCRCSRCRYCNRGYRRHESERHGSIFRYRPRISSRHSGNRSLRLGNARSLS